MIQATDTTFFWNNRALLRLTSQLSSSLLLDTSSSRQYFPFTEDLNTWLSGSTQGANSRLSAPGLKHTWTSRFFPVTLLLFPEPFSALTMVLLAANQETWASQVALVMKNLPVMRETQETRVWFLGLEDLVEEEMVTHSSVLAWRIPWTMEPGGL